MNDEFHTVHQIVNCLTLTNNCLQVIVFADSLIPTVRRALCDPLPEVRQVASHTFDHLHSNIGQRALDEILPYLLEQLVSRKGGCLGYRLLEIFFCLCF